MYFLCNMTYCILDLSFFFKNTATHVFSEGDTTSSVFRKDSYRSVGDSDTRNLNLVGFFCHCQAILYPNLLVAMKLLI